MSSSVDAAHAHVIAMKISRIIVSSSAMKRMTVAIADGPEMSGEEIYKMSSSHSF